MESYSEKEAEVKEYYGKELQKSSDLKTNACCTIVSHPDRIKKALANIHDEVLAKYYGCGLTIPTQVDGAKVLDLGSGSGRDCYLLSQLVGESGFVIGLDMTEEQLSVAQKHIDYHKEKFGYKVANTVFKKGNIQNLKQAEIQDEEVDIVVSNCVVNLATDKLAVLKEVFRVLKEGGEFYFSDVYCSRRIPEPLRADKVLYGECLSGALYWNDFLTLAKQAGFRDPRLVESAPITIENKEVSEKLEGYEFYSATYRLFKLSQLDEACEDYGQAVRYKGSLSEEPKSFTLDDHHVFQTGRVVSVCGNTWRMLQETRYKKHFEFFGDFKQHFGIFEGCGLSLPFQRQEEQSLGEQGCC